MKNNKQEDKIVGGLNHQSTSAISTSNDTWFECQHDTPKKQCAICNTTPTLVSLDKHDDIGAHCGLLDCLKAHNPHDKENCNRCNPKVEEDKANSPESLEDCAEIMWGIICNVSEGDWTKQNKEWQDAVMKCREYYFRIK